MVGEVPYRVKPQANGYCRNMSILGARNAIGDEIAIGNRYMRPGWFGLVSLLVHARCLD